MPTTSELTNLLRAQRHDAYPGNHWLRRRAQQSRRRARQRESFLALRGRQANRPTVHKVKVSRRVLRWLAKQAKDAA